MHVFPRSIKLSYIAQLIRQLKKVFIFSVCNKPPYGALRLPVSDSVEREHQPPLIFARYFKNVRATIKMIWMVSSASSQTMLQSNINVISCYMFKVRVISAKAFFACLLIINHDISAAAEQGIDKIGNSVSERKNFTPMCSHVFFLKNWSWSRLQQNLNAGNPTDSLESESMKVL